MWKDDQKRKIKEEGDILYTEAIHWFWAVFFIIIVLVIKAFLFTLPFTVYRVHDIDSFCGLLHVRELDWIFWWRQISQTIIVHVVNQDLLNLGSRHLCGRDMSFQLFMSNFCHPSPSASASCYAATAVSPSGIILCLWVLLSLSFFFLCLSPLTLSLGNKMSAGDVCAGNILLLLLFPVIPLLPLSLLSLSISVLLDCYVRAKVKVSLPLSGET